jgi:hypothetical protein
VGIIERNATVDFERRDVTFRSGDSFVSGWFYRPEAAGPENRTSAVALGPGTCGVKELNHEGFAEHFAAAGVAALLFDYRGFGASGGEPRQRLFPRDQLEDYRSALTWLSLQPEVDAERLGVWGSSMSGGHALAIAAHDPRVKAVVAQAAPIDIHEMMRQSVGDEEFFQMEELAVRERVRRMREGGEVYAPNAVPPGYHGGFAFQPDAGSYGFFPVRNPESAPSYRNEMTMSSLEAILEYAPGLSIELIAPRPLLIISPSKDVNVSPETLRAAYARAGEPKRLLEVDGNHYSIYPTGHGENFEQVVKAGTDWFVQHLGSV